MARFHVLDRNGHWQTGAWGFAELWSHLPAYRWLAGLVRMTRGTAILDLAYERFARWRFRNRCEEAYCNPAKNSVPGDPDTILLETPPHLIRKRHTSRT